MNHRPGELVKMRRMGRSATYGLVASVASLLAPMSRADLNPDQVAVIAMQRSAPSKQVARHFARARGVSDDRILLLDIPVTPILSRADWDAMVRPRIRRWLIDSGLVSKVRCLVTVYDTPLTIDRRDPNLPAVVERREYLTAERQRCREQVIALIHATEVLLAAKGATPSAIPANAEFPVLAQRFEQVLKAAQSRISAVRDTPEAKSAATTFDRLFLTGAGLGGMIRLLGAKENQNAAKNVGEWGPRLESRRAQLLGVAQGMVALESLPDTVERDQQILMLMLQSEGVMGCLGWIEGQMSLLEANESYTSFDSELSLVLWPGYPLIRSLPNTLHYSFDNNPTLRGRPTLMVSRLEAPTLERAIQLVDRAVEVEKSDLSGVVYLDARGLPPDQQRGSNGEYDESLRNLARLLQEKTKLKVVLDNKEELFAPGSCPDAALYCGWYSLSKYIDAFQWKPGAVAYHLASMEAETLRKPQSNAWCKRMLEKGVCATLGPTFEPYLVAFPLPEDFFVALLSGKFTLAECYYRTAPFTSWVMTLVGDPFYQPFKNRPLLTANDVSPRLKAVLGVHSK